MRRLSNWSCRRRLPSWNMTLGTKPPSVRGDAVAQRLVVQRGVLARRRDAHGVFQRERLAPFLSRPRAAVVADLVDAPVQLEMMAVGIEELDRDLATGAAAALEHDLGAMVPEVLAGAEHLVERGEL